jgi:hypothetical protein
VGSGEEGEGIEGWREKEAGGGYGGYEDIPQQEAEWEDGEGWGYGEFHALLWLRSVDEVVVGHLGRMWLPRVVAGGSVIYVILRIWPFKSPT